MLHLSILAQDETDPGSVEVETRESNGDEPAAAEQEMETDSIDSGVDEKVLHCIQAILCIYVYIIFSSVFIKNFGLVLFAGGQTTTGSSTSSPIPSSSDVQPARQLYPGSARDFGASPHG